MKQYFTFRPINPNDILSCTIVPSDYDDFPMSVKDGGSYALAPSRVLGMDYPTYLRFIRDSFPEAVRIEGQDKKFPIDIWRRGQELYKFVEFLNLKLEKAVTADESQN